METRYGSQVKNPEGILRVNRTTENRNSNVIVRGKDTIVNVVNRISGRNTNILKVSNNSKSREKSKGFYKNKDDIPEHRKAKPSARSFNNTLQVGD